mgnify:FL=1
MTENVGDNPIYRKLSKEEADYVHLKIGHGGRKSEWTKILDSMEIGDMLQIYEKVNRGTISRIGQKLGKKFAVHYVDAHYYIERIA